MYKKEEVREKIFELADDKYKEFQSKLCPDVNNIIGVRVPLLKKYAKEIAKKDYKLYLDNASDEYYEEIMLQGLVIGYTKMEIEERKKYIMSFVPKINNWAVCDVFCSNLKFTNKNEEVMWEFIQPYIKSEKEFEVRFALVIMINFYITDEYINKVIDVIKTIQNELYYVRMAIAWLISVAYVKYPSITIKYIKNNSLDDFTYNKALQKIIESYRVSAKDKEIIKKLKRKITK